MSKKLKLDTLKVTRSLRSGNKPVDANPSNTTSEYFEKNENTSPKKPERKRRTPIKKYEETENRDKISPKKSEKKRRTPVKIKYEETENMKIKVEDPKNVGTKKEDKTEQNNWMPPNWEATLEHIKEMRKHRTAPVDEMGCHKCADPKAPPKVSRFQSLVALMLSSQTKDQITHAAMQRLNSYGCTPEILANTPNDVLEKLIYPVGFWKKKIEYIKRTSVILTDKYESDIPKTIKELCDLPGVGPKMAHICMQIAWGEVSGIGVDTHVHRICNRLKWVEKPTKTPEETRIALEKWLPKDSWSNVNQLLVGFGQEICLPRFPKCSECLNKNICPFVGKNGTSKKA